MKLIILQEKLKEGLNIIERVSSKSLTLPILNNVLISTEKNFLNLSATDLEIGIKWWGLVKIEEEGAITTPSHLFSNFINLLPNKKITLEEKNKNLLIECENYKTQIKGISAEEFPLIPKISQNDFILINNISFCQGLAQVVDIASLSTTRPEISGVFISFQNDLIIIAATDSFRLGEKKIFLKSKSTLKQKYSLIIPQKTIKEVITILSNKKGESKIYFSPNQIMFESIMEETDHPQIQIISRLIEGEYPNYQEIIPKKSTTQIIINKEDLLKQIKTASLFSGRVSEVKIKADPKEKTIEIFSQSPDIGEYRSLVLGKTKGEPIEIAFSHKFLLDGLLSIKSAEVVFELNGDAGPGVLKPIGDDSYLYVVMPIKAN